MTAKQYHFATGFLFMAILLVCLITLLLPTSVVLIPDNDIIRQQPFIIGVSTLFNNHAFVLPSHDTQLTHIVVRSLSLNAVIEYPKYYIGLIIVMGVAVFGLYWNSAKIGELENEQV